MIKGQGYNNRIRDSTKLSDSISLSAQLNTIFYTRPMVTDNPAVFAKWVHDLKISSCRSIAIFSRGNRHPLPPPLAQNGKSVRQRKD